MPATGSRSKSSDTVLSRRWPHESLRCYPRVSRHSCAGGNPENNRKKPPLVSRARTSARAPSVTSWERATAKAGIGFLLLAFLLYQPALADTDPDTRLVIAEGYELVKAQCTVCHSARLVVQNRADRAGWLQMIRWMQETQGLWPLGDSEPVILDYLATHYGPLPRGRRMPLDVKFDTPSPSSPSADGIEVGDPEHETNRFPPARE